ncbi:MAG TPA: HlyC/CorC family transporter [Solimonas sp.]
MDALPLSALFGLLVLLLALSAFFSGSETGLVAVNRHRLRTRASNRERGARWAHRLLERPDRLIGTILIGKHFVNALAAAVATLIALELFPGASGLIGMLAVLTFALLIFSEVMPKTLAALHAERVAVTASLVYWFLRLPFVPVVWLSNLFARVLLRLIGVTPEDAAQHSLGTEELRSVVAEAGALIPQRHQRMLQSILDLEKVTVEDIMVPRNAILGIDLTQPWELVRETIIASPHTRLPVFDGGIEQLKGVVHLRRVVRLAAENTLDLSSLLELAREPYFIPEGTPLSQQLLNFQNQKHRVGFVLDEYGDIQGLVTLEDILEEVVGEFASDPATQVKNVYANGDGSYRISGSVTVRSLNKNLGWKLPTNGPKTINGLLLEKLEALPKAGTRIDLDGYQVEIVEARANSVKAIRVTPDSAAAAKRQAHA